MLDGLLGRSFTSKCKSTIKLVISRIDIIRRKRNSMQKFLKKDIADLLANGLEINAYGRAEGLLVELNLSSCYDLVEQFCRYILKQIPVMQKQRECPEECREAIASVMFAAARFPNCPELIELRELFSERYGKSLESFVNQEFAEKMAAKPPTKEKKLQLMQDIAKDNSIKWDSKAYEQKTSKPPAPKQDQSKKQGSFHGGNDGNRLHKEDTVPEEKTHHLSSQGRRELNYDGYKSHSQMEDTVSKKDNQTIFSNGRQELSDDSSRGRRELTHDVYKSHSQSEDNVRKKDNQAVLSNGKLEFSDDSSRGRREFIHDGYRLHSHREDTVPKKDNQAIISNGRREFCNDLLQGRRELTYDEYKSHSHRTDTVPKKDNQGILPSGRRELSDDGCKPHNGRGEAALRRDHQDIPTRERREPTDNGYRLQEEREDSISKRVSYDVSSRGCQEITGDKNYPYSNRDGDYLLRREQQDRSSHRRREVSDVGYKPKRDNIHSLANREWEHSKDARKQCDGGEDTSLEGCNGGTSTHGRGLVTPSVPRRQQVKMDDINDPIAIAGDKQYGTKNNSYSRNKFTEENTESSKPFCNNVVPPPYIKPRDTRYGANSEAQRISSDNNEFSSDPRSSNRDVVRKKSERAEKRFDQFDYTARVNDYGDEKDRRWNDLVDDAMPVPKPKPKSVRRRHLKPPPGHDFDPECEEDAKRNPSVSKEGGRRGLQTLFDGDYDSKYEEEKIDKLLLHYSKKPSTYEPGRISKGSRAPHPHDTAADASQRRHHRSRDEAHMGHAPARAISLPPEPTAPELPRAPARASSFQPDGQAGHVHPKLPDCDNLAARVAALRGM